MSAANVRAREISDDRIRAMFDAFAGPESPQPRAQAMKRQATRRTLIVVLAALLALGIAVPGGLALLGLWETPKQFLADSGQPAYAKRFVREWLASHHYVMVRGEKLKLVGLTRGITASTPAGDVRMYVLRLGHGYIGFVVLAGRRPDDSYDFVDLISTTKAGADPLIGASYRPCSGNWVLQYVTGGADRIGRTRGYALGRAADSVATVEVVYPDGSTSHGAVADGYFIAWMKPAAAWTNVSVIAKDAAGKSVAKLTVAGYGGMPFWSVKPAQPFTCAR